MKNLKFRIWNKKLKVFLYQLQWERFDTRQWTGLFDKLGKEIYEGDIIKLSDGEVIEIKAPELFECDAFVVYGYKFCSGFFIENYKKVGLDSFYSESPEVIGNIYENPKLLK